MIISSSFLPEESPTLPDSLDLGGNSGVNGEKSRTVEDMRQGGWRNFSGVVKRELEVVLVYKCSGRKKGNSKMYYMDWTASSWYSKF